MSCTPESNLGDKTTNETTNVLRCNIFVRIHC